MENRFEKFNLNEKLINKLNEKRIFIPTKIQEEVIPKILNNQDVIAQSKTGTGKTLSYILPLIHLTLNLKNPILVICPTKELANQIYNEFIYFIDDFDIKIVLLLGGEKIEKQIDRIKNGYDIIVGVPGRILKLVNSGILKLSKIKKTVIEEVDFLIDLGFQKDLEKIFSLLKNNEQLLIFSATLSSKTKIALDIIKNQKIAARVDSQNRLPENIKNFFIPIENNNREEILLKLLENINPFLSIIFVRTKKESLWLYNILKEKNFLAGCLNGDLSPSQRKKQILNFKKTKIQYLVSTDLASRGIDIEGINYIINYNLPLNELDYLHRAGRCGRMGEEGYVYSLCNELDEGYLRKYSYYLNFNLTPIKITEQGLQIIENYIGVKPRFNIEEKKKIEKLKQKKNKEKKNGNKKRRNSSKR